MKNRCRCRGLRGRPESNRRAGMPHSAPRLSARTARAARAPPFFDGAGWRGVLGGYPPPSGRARLFAFYCQGGKNIPAKKGPGPLPKRAITIERACLSRLSLRRAHVLRLRGGRESNPPAAWHILSVQY